MGAPREFSEGPWRIMRPHGNSETTRGSEGAFRNHWGASEGSEGSFSSDRGARKPSGTSVADYAARRRQPQRLPGTSARGGSYWQAGIT